MSETTYIRLLDSDSNEIKRNKAYLNKLSIESNRVNDYLHININKEDLEREIKRLKQMNFSITFKIYNGSNDYYYSYVINFKNEKLIKMNMYSSKCDSYSVHWITREIAINLITSEDLDKKYEIDLICSPNDGSNEIVNMTVEAINLVNL